MRSSPVSDELVRARLAYVSLGQAPLSGPRRALPAEEAERNDGESSEAAAPEDAVPAPSPTGSTWLSRLELTRKHLIAAGVLLVCGVVLALSAMVRTQATEVELSETVQPLQLTQPAAVEPAPSPSPAPRIRVHVLGGVNTPGVVSLEGGAIVADAIEAAGGLTDDAQPGQLNLAERVVDGMQILVGLGERESEVSGSSSTGTGAGSSGGGVNLNTASQAQLEELPGIGPVTAAAIIAWRERSGGFGSVAQLREVDGIGPKTFAKLEPLVTT